MIAKILLVTLFAVCQAAKNEPWWIQMFFPNVSFTGKYHPSNYKVEKSPLFPDHVQNSNDVWSPAYWMPYKLAYSQYWIDLIDNTTKAEQEKAKEIQTQIAQQNDQLGVGGQYGQNDQYGQYGQGGQYGQYGQGGQYGQYGQGGQYGQYGQGGQYGQYGQGGQYGQYGQGGQYGQYGQSGQIESQHPGQQTPVGQASTLAQEVHAQTENMNQDAERIIFQASKEAEKQVQAIDKEAKEKKEEVAAEAQFINSQAERVSAQTDKAAEAKKEAIAQEVDQFAADVRRQFAPLYEEAEEVAEKAVEITEEVATDKQ